jgi:hypothetical protein
VADGLAFAAAGSPRRAQRKESEVTLGREDCNFSFQSPAVILVREIYAEVCRQFAIRQHDMSAAPLTPIPKESPVKKLSRASRREVNGSEVVFQHKSQRSK